MKMLSPSLVLVLAACLPSAALADKAVGTASIDMDDKAHMRKFVSELWFEAAPGFQGRGVFGPATASLPQDRAQRRAGHPPLGKRPLIVVSHGNWGTRYSQGWLAVRLVNAGYVVLSTSHPGTLGDDQSVAGRLAALGPGARRLVRPGPRCSSTPSGPRSSTTGRIAFAGHSFGGWTGVSLAGGRYRSRATAGLLRGRPDKGLLLRRHRFKDDTSGIRRRRQRLVQGHPLQGLLHHATGPGRGFLARITQVDRPPFLVDTAKADEILEPGGQFERVGPAHSAARELVRPVGHFAYVPECKWLVGPLLARAADTPICNDPKGVDRGLVHKQVADSVVDFFNKQLIRKP